MIETIVVVIVALAALSIAARKLATPGSNFPEPLVETAELQDTAEPSEAEVDSDRP